MLDGGGGGEEGGDANVRKECVCLLSVYVKLNTLCRHVFVKDIVWRGVKTLQISFW